MIRATLVGGSLEGFAEELVEDLLPRAIEAVDAASDILYNAIRDQLERVGPPIPGGPPAKVTGELLNSVQVVKATRKRRATTIRGGVRINHPAAGRLEFGGSDSRGRYIPPHPFARPADEQARPGILRRIDLIGEG